MNNRPPIYDERTRLRIRQHAREERMKRRRRRRIAALVICLMVFLGLCTGAAMLIVRFIEYTSLNAETEAPEPIAEEMTNEAPEIVFDLSTLVDPSTLDPNDSIDLYYMSSQALPRTYYTENTTYKTFADDSPELGSNVSTKVIVIDAGHQDGTRVSDVWLSPYLDPSVNSSWVRDSILMIGTVGCETGIYEYVTVHEVAALLKTRLEKLGYTVYLSHPDISEKLSGSERASVANRNNADLMISLHCDSYDEDKTVSGSLALVPEVWDGYPSRQLSYLSGKAATILLDEYTAATGLRNRGYQAITSASMFSFCKVPIVLLEMGFSSCPSDDMNMNDDDFRQKMVDGIVNGINKYFSLIGLSSAE